MASYMIPVTWKKSHGCLILLSPQKWDLFSIFNDLSLTVHVVLFVSSSYWFLTFHNAFHPWNSSFFSFFPCIWCILPCQILTTWLITVSNGTHRGVWQQIRELESEIDSCYNKQHSQHWFCSQWSPAGHRNPLYLTDVWYFFNASSYTSAD